MTFKVLKLESFGKHLFKFGYVIRPYVDIYSIPDWYLIYLNIAYEDRYLEADVFYTSSYLLQLLPEIETFVIEKAKRQELSNVIEYMNDTIGLDLVYNYTELMRYQRLFVNEIDLCLRRDPVLSILRESAKSSDISNKSQVNIDSSFDYLLWLDGASPDEIEHYLKFNKIP